MLVPFLEILMDEQRKRHKLTCDQSTMFRHGDMSILVTGQQGVRLQKLPLKK